MDWPALSLSLSLALWTVALLAPVSLFGGRWLATARFRGRGLVEAALTLPLVLPPTVLGFYLLQAFGSDSPLGALWRALFDRQLVFSFEGLVAASVIVNLPFAIQPAQRAFEAVPEELREAAACCGMSPWRRLWRIEAPLAWPGMTTAAALTFAHTLGEFGVILMVGGAIPGETRTAAIAIYDRAQAFDFEGAASLSATLAAVSLATLAVAHAASARIGRRLS